MSLKQQQWRRIFKMAVEYCKVHKNEFPVAPGEGYRSSYHKCMSVVLKNPETYLGVAKPV